MKRFLNILLKVFAVIMAAVILTGIGFSIWFYDLSQKSDYNSRKLYGDITVEIYDFFNVPRLSVSCGFKFPDVKTQVITRLIGSVKSMTFIEGQDLFRLPFDEKNIIKIKPRDKISIKFNKKIEWCNVVVSKYLPPYHVGSGDTIKSIKNFSDNYVVAESEPGVYCYFFNVYYKEVDMEMELYYFFAYKVE